MPRPARTSSVVLATVLIASLVPLAGIAIARTTVSADSSTDTGAALYRGACANCHGIDGRGAAPSIVAFEEPLPDFTDCAFATREPDADWLAVVHDGGPARAFARMMPAFGGALTVDEIEGILAHVRTLCVDRRWPRGELNLPRALVTEKAYPEDEAVVSTAISRQDDATIDTRIIYERRFGPRSQIELIVPFGIAHRSGTVDEWVGGPGDLAIAVKHAFVHSLTRGVIVSGGAEAVLPTGNATKGFSKGTPVVEPFVAYGQILPRDAFVQIQAGAELPRDTSRAAREAFWRIAAGRSFSQHRWGRTWSPMVELLGAVELDAGQPAHWDLLPQMQVTLSTRQHVMVNGGVRLPLNARAGRSRQVLLYLIWDWFDGPFFGGW